MEKIEQFHDMIKKELTVTLATTDGIRVTMRDISPVYYEGKVLFFTHPDSLKYKHLEKNSKCCISGGGFFAEADAKILGSTMLDSNEKYREEYSKKFNGAFDENAINGGIE